MNNKNIIRNFFKIDIKSPSTSSTSLSHLCLGDTDLFSSVEPA